MTLAEQKTKQAFAQPKTNLVKLRWNEGLELARAAAIALVVYAHGLPILAEDDHWKLIDSLLGLNHYFKPGWWGVRIFFALSGYLIGRQVIDTLVTGTLRSAVFFALRRWLRTVPTYWLILAIACILSGINLFSSEALKNALFLQSSVLTTSKNSIIEVAWSLVIEEWSYCACALIVIASATLWGRMTTRQAAWLLAWLALLALGGSITARLWASGHAALTWETLKKTASLQLDSLSLGGLLAALERLRPQIFRALTTHPWWTGALSFVGMCLTGWWIITIQSNGTIGATTWAWIGAVVYPLSSALSCCLLCSMWRVDLRSFKSWIKKPIKIIAKISYSLYLTHLSVSRWIGGVHGLAVPLSVTFWIYVLSAIIVGWLCWHLFEKPFIGIRRHFNEPSRG